VDMIAHATWNCKISLYVYIGLFMAVLPF